MKQNTTFDQMKSELNNYLENLTDDSATLNEVQPVNNGETCDSDEFEEEDLTNLDEEILNEKHEILVEISSNQY